MGAGELDDLAREAGAVVEAAAVRVCALVAGGAEEGVQEVAAEKGNVRVVVSTKDF